MLLDVCYNFRIAEDVENNFLVFKAISKEFGFTDDILKLLRYITDILDSSTELEDKSLEEQVKLIASSLVYVEGNSLGLSNLNSNFIYLSQVDTSLDTKDFKSEVDIIFHKNNKVRFSFVRGVCWELDDLDFADFKYDSPTVDMLEPLEDINNFTNLTISQIQSILDSKITGYKPAFLLENIFRVGDSLYEKFNYF